jgi:hypothetical protein
MDKDTGGTIKLPILSLKQKNEVHLEAAIPYLQLEAIVHVSSMGRAGGHTQNRGCTLLVVPSQFTSQYIHGTRRFTVALGLVVDAQTKGHDVRFGVA